MRLQAAAYIRRACACRCCWWKHDGRTLHEIWVTVSVWSGGWFGISIELELLSLELPLLGEGWTTWAACPTWRRQPAMTETYPIRTEFLWKLSFRQLLRFAQCHAGTASSHGWILSNFDEIKKIHQKFTNVHECATQSDGFMRGLVASDSSACTKTCTGGARDIGTRLNDSGSDESLWISMNYCEFPWTSVNFGEKIVTTQLNSNTSAF